MDDSGTGFEPVAVSNRAPSSIPLVFESAAGSVFGWYHTPAFPERRVGVVLCTPVGYEWLCSYLSYVKLAESLAAAGFPVLRFDYHGTGDSSGDDREPKRFEAWLESTRAAVRELSNRSGLSRVCLVGVRIGGLVAGLVAHDDPRVEDLVLFAPCASGKSFVRELRTYRLMQAENDGGESERRKLPGEPYEEAAGFVFTESTLTDLSNASLLSLDALPAKHVLVIPRDDMGHDKKLEKHLSQLGCDVTVQDTPGYALMMGEDSHHSEVPFDVFAEILAWLDKRHPERNTLPESRRARAHDPPFGARRNAFDAHTPEMDAPTSALPTKTDDLVRESAVVFGAPHRLFGMLTEPTDVRAREGKPALLMLNVGTNHRVGPNRMYVRMARRFAELGFPSLRFDLAGMGDSEETEEWAAQRIYTQDAVDDVVMAMDYLKSAHGIDHFVLVGLCSGAFVAYQTAIADARATGLLLINARRFYQQPVEELRTIEVALNDASYKSMRTYKKLARDPKTWSRLLRGEIDVRGIAKRAFVVGESRARAFWKRTFTKDGESVLVPAFRALCDRGTQVLFVFSEGDDGLDYVELHLGEKGSLVQRPDRLHVEIVGGSDHTFSELASQQLLCELLGRNLANDFR